MLFEEMVLVIKSDLMIFLFIVILFDFITGWAKALKWGVMDSWVNAKGTVKHTITFVFYYLIAVLLNYIHASGYSDILLMLVSLNYVLSIFENLGVMGVYMPKFLKSKVKNEIERYIKELGEKDG